MTTTGILEIVRSPEEVRRIHDLLLFVVASSEPVKRRLGPDEQKVMADVLEDASLMVSVLRWLLGQRSGFGEEIRRFEALAQSLQKYSEQEAVH